MPCSVIQMRIHPQNNAHPFKQSMHPKNNTQLPANKNTNQHMVCTSQGEPHRWRTWRHAPAKNPRNLTCSARVACSHCAQLQFLWDPACSLGCPERRPRTPPEVAGTWGPEPVNRVETLIVNALHRHAVASHADRATSSRMHVPIDIP